MFLGDNGEILMLGSKGRDWGPLRIKQETKILNSEFLTVYLP